MEIFSKRLKALRTESGKLQVDVSNDLRLSRGILSAYENGREPSFETLVAFARYFNVSTDYLLGLSEDRRPASDDLSCAVNLAASETAAAGGEPVTASDVLQLTQHLIQYLSHGAIAGQAPVALLRHLVSGMDGLLQSLISGSTASVVDASNALLQAVLEVSNVTNAFLQNNQRKEE